MKRVVSIFLFISLSFLVFGQERKAVDFKGLHHFRDMVYVPGDTFIMGRVSASRPQFNPEDSDLLYIPNPRRVEVHPFYICNHEVTNAEYGEFVKWVRDSVIRAHPEDPSFCYLKDESNFSGFSKKEYNTNLFVYHGVCIYPDTLCWSRTRYPFAFIQFESMCRIYFNTPAFKDFPVVGINWYQAMAYCQWRTVQLKAEAARHKKSMTVSFRLPAEAEWEYAALALPKGKDHDDGQRFYPWKGLEFAGIKGKYRCNMGNVVDQNGVTVQTLVSDNFLFTSKVKSFAPNFFKLYDMAGNVSEWVGDSAGSRSWENIQQADTSNYYARVSEQLDPYPSRAEKLEIVTEMLKNQGVKLDGLNNKVLTTKVESLYQAYYTKYLVLLKIRNELICKGSNSRIVKGGSWEDGAVYQQCASREALDGWKSKCSLGFRVAIGVQY